jgi:hypothetical protein
MYIDFVLTQSRPNADPVTRTLQVGDIHDGFIVAASFPHETTFGGLIQVSFEPEDWGEFEIELFAGIVGTDHRQAVENWLETLPPPSPGWQIPRVFNYPFETTLTAAAEMEQALTVEINREEIGARYVKVVGADAPW